MRAERLILTNEVFRLLEDWEKIVEMEDDCFMEAGKPVLDTISTDRVCAGWLYTSDGKFLHPAQWTAGKAELCGVVTDTDGKTAYVASIDVFYYDEEENFFGSREQYYSNIEEDIRVYAEEMGMKWREPLYVEMVTMMERNRGLFSSLGRGFNIRCTGMPSTLRTGTRTWPMDARRSTTSRPPRYLSWVLKSRKMQSFNNT